MKSMYKLTVQLFTLALVFLSNTSCKSQTKTASEKPNIIVFLCDDLGFGDLSSYGHSIIKTPNIDKLAEQGIKFNNFYSAAPVCSPSRVGLLTGRNPNRAGIYDFIIGGTRKREDFKDLVHLKQEEKTIATQLKTVGYSTALVGKWHCSSLFNNEKQPQADDFGFDHWFATHNNASPTHQNPKNFVRNGTKVGPIEGFSCQIVVDEAMDWLSTIKKENPYYLQLTFHEPHEPIASPEDLVAKYMPFAKNVEEAKYFANVENVDRAVGRMLDFIEKRGDDNTIIVFTSDNGPETLNRHPKAKRSYGTPGELKGMKLWTSEAGMHVPGIIYWKGKEGFSGTSDAVVSSLDFLPTFCEIAGAKLPKKEMDGESIAELLNTGNFKREKPLLWSFYNALNDHQIAMRNGDWKMLARLKNGDTYIPKFTNMHTENEQLIKESELVDFELYNLKEDIKEANELAAEQPKVFKSMKKLLKKEYKKLLADSPTWARDSH